MRDLAALPRRALPPFPGWRLALGPGIVWLALAQGSGELIWWPYLVAKYGLTFLFLLVPACLLQYPLSLEIGRYTMLTGESIFQGFFRLGRGLGVLLWTLMTLSFLWFGAFASAGGTAIAALTGWPRGWSPRAQTLFWAYASIALFVLAMVFSRVVYALIERFMKVVALVTVAGLLWACLHPDVLAAMPAFLRGFLSPSGPMPRPWDPDDATKLLTAITFAGLGGFWVLFYSYWLREKGSGMAAHVGRITGVAGRPEPVPSAGWLPEAVSESGDRWRRWRTYLTADALVGIIGNLATTAMTCLLAWTFLFPQGLLPEEYEIAVVQSRFFEMSWGPIGRMVFLVVAAAFLADGWLATADGVSRMHADVLHILFPGSRRVPLRRWYFSFLGILTVITGFTMLLDAPGPLILTSAVIGFMGTVIFPPVLYVLNHRRLAPVLPAWARPRPVERWLLAISFVAYLGLAVAYLWMTFGR